MIHRFCKNVKEGESGILGNDSTAGKKKALPHFNHLLPVGEAWTAVGERREMIKGPL